MRGPGVRPPGRARPRAAAAHPQQRARAVPDRVPQHRCRCSTSWPATTWSSSWATSSSDRASTWTGPPSTSARLFLSYLGSHGSWDLADRDQVRRLVRTQLLAGVVVPTRADVPAVRLSAGVRPIATPMSHTAIASPLAMRQIRAYCLSVVVVGEARARQRRAGAPGRTAGDRPRDASPTAPWSCIARWGTAKTTLDDIAREAGCSRATIYRLFPGRQAGRARWPPARSSWRACWPSWRRPSRPAPAARRAARGGHLRLGAGHPHATRPCST